MIIILISFICGIFAIIFCFKTVRQVKKEKLTKSTCFNAVAAFFLAVSSVISLINITLPSPEIYPLNEKTATYVGFTEVTISNNNLLFQIYYSLDGSDPKNGNIYEEPIIVDESTTVAAKNKFLFWWSDVVDRAYIIEKLPTRPTYALQEINNGVLGDNITFNSIIYNETFDSELYARGRLKNETNFVGARFDTGGYGVNNVWHGSEVFVYDGETYVVRLYVHNNSPKGTDATAENVKVRFYVPYASGTEVAVNGWLTATNATPDIYLDDVVFKSLDGTAFHLEYVTGSAMLQNGGFASGEGIKLTDSVVNQGNPTGENEDTWTMIGYDALDGKIPGGYNYVNYVFIKVKVVYDR